MEKARCNTELYSNLRVPLNNVKPSNLWGSQHQSPYFFVFRQKDGMDCGGLRSLRSLRPLPQSTSSRYRGTRILRAPPPARVRGWTRLRNPCHPSALLLLKNY